MGVSISIRLDDEISTELEALAAARGVGLSAYISDVATGIAREARRARIRASSAEVHRRAPFSPEGRSLYDLDDTAA